jgi:hypothetical protein
MSEETYIRMDPKLKEIILCEKCGKTHERGALSYCKYQRRGLGVAFVRYANPRMKKCRWCERPSTKLCDFVVSPPEQRTCNAPMCDAHAKRVGPNLDHCPEHA